MAAGGDNCTNVIPSSEDFFRNVDVGYIVLIAVCAVLTITIIGIYIEEILCILRAAAEDRTERRRPIWMFGLYPVMATTSLISLCVPRTTELNDLVAALYLSMCILQFLKIIISYFGGRDRMISALAHVKLKLSNRRGCSCCVCCPEISVNKRNIMKMYYMVLQVIIIRPLLFYCTSAYLADVGNESMARQEVVITISVLHMVSTITAMTGLGLVFKVSRRHLEVFYIKRKFAMLQLVLTFVDLQNGIFNLLATFGVIPCTAYGFTSKARASNIHHTVLIFEMFLLAIQARFNYRKKEPLSLLKIYTEGENEALSTETSSATPNYGTIHVTDNILSGLDESHRDSVDVSEEQTSHGADVAPS